VFVIVLEIGLVLFRSVGVRTVNCSKTYLACMQQMLTHYCMKYVVIVVIILSISN